MLKYNKKVTKSLNVVLGAATKIHAAPSKREKVDSPSGRLPLHRPSKVTYPSETHHDSLHTLSLSFVVHGVTFLAWLPVEPSCITLDKLAIPIRFRIHTVDDRLELRP